MVSDRMLRGLTALCGTSLLTLACLFSSMAPLTAGAKSITGHNSNIAEILNSGSTNTCGYKIYVTSDGRELYHMCYNHGHGKLSAALAEKFLHDIQTAGPLNKLPSRGCIKSAGFGTKTTIQYHGQLSPDISCPANHLEELLYADAVQIEQALQVNNQPKQH